MGTSGSYTGGGGKPGRDLRDGIADWADTLPSSPPSDEAPPAPANDGPRPMGRPAPCRHRTSVRRLSCR